MNNEDKKILAEWFGWIVNKNPLWSGEGDNIFEKYFFISETDGDISFNPESDSNQLDMLEDKMIKDFNIILYSVSCTDSNFNAYYTNKLLKHIDGTGKTKNEARLNAILSYVKGVTK